MEIHFIIDVTDLSDEYSSLDRVADINEMSYDRFTEFLNANRK